MCAHAHMDIAVKAVCALRLCREQVYLVVGQLLGDCLQAAGLQEVGGRQAAGHLQQPLFYLLELAVVLFVVFDFCLQTADMFL